MNTDYIKQATEKHRIQLLEHPLYNNINTLKELKIFLSYHVYAVWDFMSLLKALQNKLTCTQVPWHPVGNPEIRYLINEIVLAEETDLNLNGKRQSHFEMYVEAMQALQMDTIKIENSIKSLSKSKDIISTIESSDLNPGLKDFLKFTFNIALNGKPHEIAAVFTFGREDLIPSMFTSILNKFQVNLPQTNLEKLIYYFERHIGLDEDEHGPMARKMVSELCENDIDKWNEAKSVSEKALEIRFNFWNAILETITS